MFSFLKVIILFISLLLNVIMCNLGVLDFDIHNIWIPRIIHHFLFLCLTILAVKSKFYSNFFADEVFVLVLRSVQSFIGIAQIYLDRLANWILQIHTATILRIVVEQWMLLLWLVLKSNCLWYLIFLWKFYLLLLYSKVALSFFI